MMTWSWHDLYKHILIAQLLSQVYLFRWCHIIEIQTIDKNRHFMDIEMRSFGRSCWLFCVCVCVGWRLGVPQPSVERSLTKSLESSCPFPGSKCSGQDRRLAHKDTKREGWEEWGMVSGRLWVPEQKVSMTTRENMSVMSWDWSYTDTATDYNVQKGQDISWQDDRMGQTNPNKQLLPLSLFSYLHNVLKRFCKIHCTKYCKY